MIESGSDFNDMAASKGIDAVRQHLVSAHENYVAENSNPEDCINSRFTLEQALPRYYLLESGEKIWDAVQYQYISKSGLKDLLGSDLYKQWLAHGDRRSISDTKAHKLQKERYQLNLHFENDQAWQNNFLLTDSGKVRSDISNAKLVLDNDKRWQGILSYCEFSYRIMKLFSPPFDNSTVGEWTDTDTDRLRIWLSENYAFTPKNADALGAVVVAAESNPSHPVREYLRSLKWDKAPRVRSWLHSYLGTEESRYHSLVGTMWLVGAVARVMCPPVKMDNVIIFEGLQGLGKSTALEILGGEWFTDTPLVLGDKDSFQQMQGVWIIELAELDSLNKAENTRAKQFFGSTTDRYRPSYGRMVKTYPRQCVFAGSTNQDRYFKDSTGNRRYWPVMCSRVDTDRLAQDRDQLWAEAFHHYRNGELWWPQSHDKELFEDQQEDRFESDVWEELIEDWLYSISRPRVLISEVMAEALRLEPGHMKPPEQKRVGQIMARLKWRKCRPRINGKRETGYEAPPDWKSGHGT